MDPRCDAFLMIGFGGPGAPDEVRPFLDDVLRGRRVPRERYEEVVRHYEAIGGRSPYNELTARQATALRVALSRHGPDIPVHLGMRNWRPHIRDAIGEIARGGAQRILGFVLAPHRCEASWDRYQASVRESLDELKTAAPAIDYCEPWHAHPLFIEAISARAAAALAQLSAAERSSAQLIFTAHSIPSAMAAASRYIEEIKESARLVAQTLGRSAWSIAYQSRSGAPGEPWLEPGVGAALRGLHGRPAVVVPVGFVCDHVEVLYDLDIEAAAIARENGIHMVRAQTVGDHPRFIEMMAAIIRHHAGA